MTAFGVIIGILLLATAFLGGGYLSISYLSNYLGMFGAIVVTFILWMLIIQLIQEYDKYKERKRIANLKNERLKKLKKDD